MTSYALLKAVHLLAVVLWVGGMAFAHFFLRPALGMLDPPQRVRLMHAVLQRFLAAVAMAVLLVLGSGLWMIGSVARQAAAGGAASFIWPVDWLAMAAVGLAMVAIYGHVHFVLYRRLTQAVAAQDWPAGAAALLRIRRWVGINLALGVALIVFVVLV